MANQEASDNTDVHKINTNFENFETKYVWDLDNCSKINLKKHVIHSPVKLTNNHGELTGHIMLDFLSSYSPDRNIYYNAIINWNPSKFEEINKATIQFCLFDKCMNALLDVSEKANCLSKSTNLKIRLAKDEEFQKHLGKNNLSFVTTVTVVCATRKTIEDVTVEKTFMEDILKEFRSLDYADITIKVKNRIFRAHKFILMCRSDVFRNRLNTGMFRQMVIDDMEPEDFEELLLFIYTDAISDEKKATVNLCKAAKKFNLTGLRNFCEKQLANNIDCGNAESIFNLGVSFDNEVLRKEAVRFIVKNKAKFQNSVIESLCKHREFLKFMIEFM